MKEEKCLYKYRFEALEVGAVEVHDFILLLQFQLIPVQTQQKNVRASQQIHILCQYHHSFQRAQQWKVAKSIHTFCLPATKTESTQQFSRVTVSLFSFYYSRMWFLFIPLKDAILDCGFDKRMTASFVIIMKIDKNFCVLIALASQRPTAYQLSDFQGTKETATREPDSIDTLWECGTIGDPEIGALLVLRSQEIRSKKLEI